VDRLDAHQFNLHEMRVATLAQDKARLRALLAPTVAPVQRVDEAPDGPFDPNTKPEDFKPGYSVEYADPAKRDAYDVVKQGKSTEKVLHNGVFKIENILDDGKIQVSGKRNKTHQTFIAKASEFRRAKPTAAIVEEAPAEKPKKPVKPTKPKKAKDSYHAESSDGFYIRKPGGKGVPLVTDEQGRVSAEFSEDRRNALGVAPKYDTFVPDGVEPDPKDFRVELSADGRRRVAAVRLPDKWDMDRARMFDLVDDKGFVELPNHADTLHADIEDALEDLKDLNDEANTEREGRQQRASKSHEDKARDRSERETAALDLLPEARAATAGLATQVAKRVASDKGILSDIKDDVTARALVAAIQFKRLGALVDEVGKTKAVDEIKRRRDAAMSELKQQLADAETQEDAKNAERKIQTLTKASASLIAHARDWYSNKSDLGGLIRAASRTSASAARKQRARDARTGSLDEAFVPGQLAVNSGETQGVIDETVGKNDDITAGIVGAEAAPSTTSDLAYPRLLEGLGPNTADSIRAAGGPKIFTTLAGALAHHNVESWGTKGRKSRSLLEALDAYVALPADERTPIPAGFAKTLVDNYEVTREALASYQSSSTRLSNSKAGTAARMAEAEALGLVEGDPASIVTALNRIANGQFTSGLTDLGKRHLRAIAHMFTRPHLAEAMASIRGLDFSLDNNNYAAVYRLGTHSIHFNFGNNWGGMSLAQVLIEEVGHALTVQNIIDPADAQTRALVKEMDTMRTKTLKYLKQVRPDVLVREDPNIPNPVEYALSNTKEFASHMLSDPSFVALMHELPQNLTRGSKKTASQQSWFMQMIRKLWSIMTGRTVIPGSPFDQAMHAVFDLVQRPFTIPTAENALHWALEESGMYVGERSNLSEEMRTGLETAKAMALGGKTSEEIRAVTGWFPGIGKGNEKLRYEVPDNGVKLKPGWREARNVGELLDHPRLFAAYPELEDAPFEFMGGGAGGITESGTLILPHAVKGLSDDNAGIIGGVLHELQHLIQKREGFARGGNLHSIYNAEKERILTQQTEAELTKFRAKAAYDANGTEENFAAWKASVSAVWDTMGAKPKRRSDEEEMDYYLRIAGEIEARDIDARKNYTPEQRKALAPYDSQNIDPKDAIVMFGRDAVDLTEDNSKFPKDATATQTPGSPLSNEETLGLMREQMPEGYGYQVAEGNGNAVWVEENAPGVIYVDPAQLSKELAGLNPVAMQETVAALLDEEVAHHEDMAEMPKAARAKMVGALTDATREWVARTYLGDHATPQQVADFKAKDEQVLFEGLRIARQVLSKGATTEDIRAQAEANPGFFAHVYEYLRRMVAKAVARLGLNPNVEALRRIRSMETVAEAIGSELRDARLASGGPLPFDPTYAAGAGFFYNLDAYDPVTRKLGRRVIGKDETLSIPELKQMGNNSRPLKDLEIKLYQDLVPGAFSGGRVNIGALAAGLASAEPVVQVHVYGQDGNVSEEKRQYYELRHSWFDSLDAKAKARIQHFWDTERVEGLSPDELEKASEMSRLYKTFENETNDTLGPRATSAYDSVSPFDPKKFPVARVDVVLPQRVRSATDTIGADLKGWEKGRNSKEGLELESPLWRQDNTHENLPNTLGWAMVQVVPHPSIPGEKVMHVGESQSRWQQEVQKDKKALKDQAWPKDSQNPLAVEARNKAISKDHPLLDSQHELVLKAVIRHAQEQGIKYLVISDGESAMMTEGHDTAARSHRVYPANDNNVALAKAIVGDKPFWDNNVGAGESEILRMLASGEDAASERYGVSPSLVERYNKQKGTNFAYPEFVDRYDKVSQEGGMRLHYDTTLPSTMKKLTGDSGQPVDLGVHKNTGGGAGVISSEHFFSKRYNGETDAQLLADAAKSAREGFGVDHAKSEDFEVRGDEVFAKRGLSKGSPVFRNPDGSPKSNATGRIYSLANLNQSVLRLAASARPTGELTPEFRIFSSEHGAYKATGAAFGAGRANAEIWELKLQRNAANLANQHGVNNKVRDLKLAAKQEKLDLALRRDDVSKALGNNENQLAFTEKKRLEDTLIAAKRAANTVRAKAYADANAIEGMNPTPTQSADAALMRENARKAHTNAVAIAQADFDLAMDTAYNQYRARIRAEQKAALASLASTPKVRDAVVALRASLDGMQRELLASGQLSNEMQAVVTDSLGLYLHRSYQLDDNKAWAAFVLNSKDPKEVAIRNRALDFLRTEMAVDKAKELRRAATKAAPVSKAQAIADANAYFTTQEGVNEVQAAMEELLSRNPGMRSTVQGNTLGGKPSSILKRRGDIPTEIQELWGRHTDPLVNATKTHTLIGALMASDRMYRGIVEDGIAKGYFFKKSGETTGIVPLLEYSEQNKKAYPHLFQPGTNEPYYGVPILRDALAELRPQQGSPDSVGATVWSWMMKATGFSMAMKTVASVQATFRDLLSNLVVMTVNGNVGAWKHLPESMKLYFRDTGNFMQPKDMMKRQAMDDLIHGALERRVMATNVTVNSVQDLLDGLASEQSLLHPTVAKAVNSAGNVLGAVKRTAVKARAFSDDVTKLALYLHEFERMKRWHPKMGEKEQLDRAAEKVRMISPTYSETSLAVSTLRRQPFIAPFVTFSAEVLRISYTTLKLAGQEMRSNVRGEQIAGLARAAGMTTMLTLIPAAIAAMSRFGKDDDDDKLVDGDELHVALTRFISPWQQGNQLMWAGREGNRHSYFDASYLLPFDLLGDTIHLVYRELAENPDNITALDKLTGALEKALMRLTKPFKEQIAFGSILDVVRNQQGAEGPQELYDSEVDSWLEKFAKSAGHIYHQAVEPGVVRSGRLILKGINKDVDGSGRAYNTFNEWMATIGFKLMAQDIDTRLQRLANENYQSLSKITMIASVPFGSKGTQDSGDLTDAFNKMNDARRKVLGESRKDWLAAQKLGMTASEATQQLVASNLTKDDVAAIVNNRYMRHGLSDIIVKRAQGSGRGLGQDRVAIYNDAFSAYPAMQPLLDY
jgi:hypothetical protein